MTRLPKQQGDSQCGFTVPVIAGNIRLELDWTPEPLKIPARDIGLESSTRLRGARHSKEWHHSLSRQERPLLPPSRRPRN